jgi:hypothetical protein
MQSKANQVALYNATTSASAESPDPGDSQVAAAKKLSSESRAIAPRPHWPSLERLASQFIFIKPSLGLFQ